MVCGLFFVVLIRFYVDFFFFFFSSRRRHTSSLRDWSSDVCSSDLDARAAGGQRGRQVKSQAGRTRRVGDGKVGRRQVRDAEYTRRPGIRVGRVGAREIGRATCRERRWMKAGGGGRKRKEGTDEHSG